MRRLLLRLTVVVAILLASCAKQSEFVGIVQSHSEDTLTVLNPIEDREYLFNVEQDDFDTPLPQGTPVVVTYAGQLTDGAKALHVAADATYIAAVGRWITSDTDDATSQYGVELRGGGRVAAVGFNDVPFHNWEPQGEDNTLLLRGRSAAGEEIIRAAIISEEQGMLFLTIEQDNNLYRKVL